MSYILREDAYPIGKKVVDAIANGEYHAGVFAYDIMDWIDEIPAADVRPVVRGRWNAVKGALHPAETSAVCSNCGFATMIHAQTFYHFCPNCGARMEES